MQAPWLFKPGQSGNPGGKPKSLLTKAQVKVAFQKFAIKTRKELLVIMEDPNALLLDVMIAAVIMRVIKEGDANKLQFLLDRAVGRVDESAEPDEYAALSTQELIKIVREKLPTLELEAKVV